MNLIHAINIYFKFVYVRATLTLMVLVGLIQRALFQNGYFFLGKALTLQVEASEIDIELKGEGF